jgi:hypothetical protein
MAQFLWKCLKKESKSLKKPRILKKEPRILKKEPHGNCRIATMASPPLDLADFAQAITLGV